MASRSAEARQTQMQLSAATGGAVDAQRASSSRSRGGQWHMLAIVRSVRPGPPPMGDFRRSSELQDHLRDVPNPKRGTDSTGESAAGLCKLSPAGIAQHMADQADRYRLAGLCARLTPPHNVLPFRRPDRR